MQAAVEVNASLNGGVRKIKRANWRYFYNKRRDSRSRKPKPRRRPFLSALVGCEVYELEVKPDIKNLSFAGRSGDVKLNRIKKLVYLVRRFYIMKISAKRLAGQGKRRIFRWLRCADGESLLREAREVLNRSTEGNFASELKASPDRPAFDEEKSKAVTTASTPKKLGAFGMNALFFLRAACRLLIALPWPVCVVASAPR